MEITWVVVADSARARIFEAETPLAPLQEINVLVNPDARLSDQDLVADKEGKIHDRHGAGRHSLEPPTDAKEQENIVFTKRIAAQLETALNRNAFGRLILVASPAVLGRLRKALDGKTAKAVVFELDKNLSQLGPQAIRQHLPEKFPYAGTT